MGIDFSSKTANRVGWAIVAMIVIVGFMGWVADEAGQSGYGGASVSPRPPQEPGREWELHELVKLKVLDVHEMGASGVMVETEVRNIINRHLEAVPIRLCAKNAHGTIITWDDQTIRNGLPAGEVKYVEFFLDNIKLEQIQGYTYKFPE